MNVKSCFKTFCALFIDSLLSLIPTWQSLRSPEFVVTSRTFNNVAFAPCVEIEYTRKRTIYCIGLVTVNTLLRNLLMSERFWQINNVLTSKQDECIGVIRKEKWMHEEWKEKLIMWQAQELHRHWNYLRHFLISFLSVDACIWCGVTLLCFFVFVVMENISLHSSLFLSGLVYSEREKRGNVLKVFIILFHPISFVYHPSPFCLEYVP